MIEAALLCPYPSSSVRKQVRVRWLRRYARSLARYEADEATS